MDDTAVLDSVARRVVPDDESMGDWTSTYYRNHRGRFLEDLDIARQRFGSDEPILELGSAPYFVTGALAELGYAVTGVDIAPERFSRTIADLGLTVQRCDIEQEPLPFADGAFAHVMMNELFEHLRMNPIRTMREVVRVMRPGADLLISTPNLRSFRGLLRLVVRGRAYAIGADVYEEYSKLEHLGHMGHVREYTPVEVSDFLERCGLRVTEVVYRGKISRLTEKAACKFVPSLSPYFTIVATKA